MLSPPFVGLMGRFPRRSRNPNVFQLRLSSASNCSRGFTSSHCLARPSALDVSVEQSPELLLTRRAQLFVDAFPIRIGIFDPRYYVAFAREEATIQGIRSQLSSVKTNGFAIVDILPAHKEGGAFVTFDYTSKDPDAALETVFDDVKKAASQNGGLPSWEGRNSHVWLVKGTPWIEDMPSIPSDDVKVEFEGPDIRRERLYELFRPFGRIRDIVEPVPVPAGTLRSATIRYGRHRSSATARNVLHGLKLTAPGSTSPTTLYVSFTRPMSPHKILDWLLSHPRIVLPVLAFILGSVTYAIFDPIRSFMVQGKLQDWFEIREFRIYQWLRNKSMEFKLFTPVAQLSSADEAWEERQQVDSDLRAYLTDWPSTITFIHGPQGSGKSSLTEAVLKDADRSVLTIDCRTLLNANSDSQLLKNLASQVGYWPFFTFMNSISHLVDLVSVGLIGQKSNLSSTLNEQVREMLGVVRAALKQVGGSHRQAEQRQVRKEAREEQHAIADSLKRERIEKGTYHDGRIDDVAGTGIPSELGIGDERLDDLGQVAISADSDKRQVKKKQHSRVEVGAVKALPVVVIKNFAARSGTNSEMYDVFAEWAAGLVENRIAHVIVISDNRENSKRVAKALSSKPLNTIALYDADSKSALAFVQRKLKDADIDIHYSSSDMSLIERLGGRASDLNTLIHKVSSGISVEEAIQDIVTRGVSETRKNAFGDDAEDAKDLKWNSQQAWHLFKLLAQQTEVPYYQTLLEFPFKGDETALRAMEHAELISINTRNGRPSTIRSARPVDKYIFGQLVDDAVFRATQDIAFNEKQIAAAESAIKSCEQELLTLKDLGAGDQHWWTSSSASTIRARYLFSKMHTAASKIESWEKQNTDLKKALTKDN